VDVNKSDDDKNGARCVDVNKSDNDKNGAWCVDVNKSDDDKNGGGQREKVKRVRQVSR
jgi:hypothetical protein